MTIQDRPGRQTSDRRPRTTYDEDWTLIDRFCRPCWRQGKYSKVFRHEPIDHNRLNIAPWNWAGKCSLHCHVNGNGRKR